MFLFTRALLAQVGAKIKLIANEDIDIGELKLAPAADRMTIEKAAPEITEGRPIIKNTEDGVIELIVLSTTFEHKGSRWAVVMRSKRGIESANDGRQPSGTPFWFGKCVPQGIHNCEIEVVNRTVPGLIVAIPIATNTSEIKKGDQIMVWNPFTMPPQARAWRRRGRTPRVHRRGRCSRRWQGRPWWQGQGRPCWQGWL